MNPDTPNTFARCAITVLAGSAILYATGRYLGWWVVSAIVLAGLGDIAWCASRLWPWRPK